MVPVSTSSSCSLQQKVLHGRFSFPGGASVRIGTGTRSPAARVLPSSLQGDKSQVSTILIWESKVWNSALDPPQASWASKYFKSNILSPNIYGCKACLEEILKSSFRHLHVLYDTDSDRGLQTGLWISHGSGALPWHLEDCRTPSQTSPLHF